MKTLVFTVHKQLGAGANPPLLSKTTVNTQPAPSCTCSDEHILSQLCGFPLNWVISKEKKVSRLIYLQADKQSCCTDSFMSVLQRGFPSTLPYTTENHHVPGIRSTRQEGQCVQIYTTNPQLTQRSGPII